jgi:hypothetical protein
MRRVADGQLEVTQAFGQELYFSWAALRAKPCARLRRDVQTRTGRHRTGRRYARPATRHGARVHVAVALYASAGIAGTRPADLGLPGQRAAIADATLKTDRIFAAARSTYSDETVAVQRAR